MASESTTLSNRTIGGVECRCYLPEGADFVVVFLADHNATPPDAYPAMLERLSAAGLGIVAPLVAACWWSQRTSNGFGEAASPVLWIREHLLPGLMANRAITPPAIALVGVEVGGQAALRLSYWYPNEFPVVAAVRPAIDFHRCLQGDAPTPDYAASVRMLYTDAEQARQDTATLHIHPLNWPRNQWFACPPGDRWWDGCERLRMKLFSLGVMHSCDLETESDSDDATLARAVDYAAERLAAERRRV